MTGSTIDLVRRRRRRAREQRLWAGAYAAVLIAPVVLMWLSPHAEEAAKQFAVALGLAAFTGMSLQVALAARLPALVRAGGMDVLIRLHRYMGVVLLAAVAMHILVFMLVWGTVILRWMFFVDRSVTIAWAGASAWWALVLLAVTSVWRRRLGWSYERWRVVHLVLTAIALFGGYLHMLRASEFVGWGPIRWFATAMLLAAVASFSYLRVGRAFRATGSPYAIDSVRREQGGAVTVRMLACGHGGLPFRPGDVAWLRFAGAPYAITEHPFSAASSTRDTRALEFTCKVVGDLTGSLERLPAGQVVFVDGPHGRGRPDLHAPGHVLVTAGIGIAPAMSLLRTLADDPSRADVPILLVHGARSLEDVTFGAEIERLRPHLPQLHVVYALSRPNAGWTGHVGRIDSSLLERVAGPAATSGWEIFACGPTELLVTVERAFARLGVPATQLHVERFEGV